MSTRHEEIYKTEQLPNGNIRIYDRQHPHEIRYSIGEYHDVHKYHAQTEEEAVEYARRFIEDIQPTTATAVLLCPDGRRTMKVILRYRDGDYRA